MSTLTRSGGTAKQNQLFGESQIVVANFLFQIAPDGFENDLSVFDFEVDCSRAVDRRDRRFGHGGCGLDLGSS